ncbi:PGL/p-HBAD biosynthesis glycosyltransferase [Sulfitobacter sp. THAF37]|uniref:TIGR04283 family arsenosugar biosynthesis glycosyltransferase n=1 Tax=Sulfitobacter sp. THAF37 TaxID=2587855 RepID=UPI001268E0F1|nr:TIGR04283 family arsenosugar biosynthesis glycosyltransferase [Sulfitobacter sp. THAF37]QFT59197.1 PGL/p-HBAD biosynthesis glycosyltransferase [Sulfitobacter sp. THAF37]
MRAPISVIIPTLDAADVLPGCLSALMEGLEAGLIRELIVSDGGSSDATGALGQAWGAQVLHGDATRGGQLRRGCAAAQGDWLLILHADTRLQPGWSGRMRDHLMADNRAGWCRLKFDGGGVPARLVSGWANLRSRLGLPYGDQGLLLSRELYDAAGGYPDIPLMEDVAIARALRGRLTGIDVTAVTSAEKYRQRGWLRQGARNLWTLLRYRAGADPARLARSYRG